MIRFLSISSGSNGNCYYIGDGTSAVLVDVGVGFRTVKKRLEQQDVDLRSIEAVFVTHEHSDHIKGLGTLAKKLSVPVFAPSRLHDALSRTKYAEECYPGCRRVIRPGMLYEHRGVKFFCFEVSHDAAQTLSYGIDFKGVRLLIMTDLGYVPEGAAKYAAEADYIVIESNYDVDMLMTGPYPPDLKARIIGTQGHLDNRESAQFISSVFHEGLKGVFLCHISKENNTPETACRTMRSALERKFGPLPPGFLLEALPRTEVYYTELKIPERTEERKY